MIGPAKVLATGFWSLGFLATALHWGATPLPHDTDRVQPSRATPLAMAFDSTLSRLPERDSLVRIVVSAAETRLLLAVLNPCEVRLRGMVSTTADTVRVDITGMGPGMDCPAQYRSELWHAVLPPLGPGRYTVRVAFRGADGRAWATTYRPLRTAARAP